MGLFTVIAILSLIVGILLIAKQPLTKNYGLPSSLETGIGTLFVLGFIFYFSAVYLIPKIAAEGEQSQPCAVTSIEMRCYNVSQDSCTTVWSSLQERCTSEVKANLNPDRATALVGPMIKQCIQRSFDSSLRSTRRFSEDPDCKARFKEIDAPRVE